MKVNTAAITTTPTVGNKTGSWRMFKPIVSERCTGCGSCVVFCPEGCIEIKTEGKRKAVIDYDYCKGCMICAAQCPQKAVKTEE